MSVLYREEYEKRRSLILIIFPFDTPQLVLRGGSFGACLERAAVEQLSETSYA